MKREGRLIFYSLQLLRFLSAIMVLLFHLEIFSSGYKGVDIFFVISGFVMYLTLFYEGRPSVQKFIVNRLTKIFFLYWVALLGLFILQPFKTDLPFFKTLFLFPSHLPLLGVSWSLSYELYFYFLLALIVYLVPFRFQKNLVAIIFMLSFCLTVIALFNAFFKGTIINFLLGSNLWQFLLGLVCGHLSLSFVLHEINKQYLAAALASFILLFAISVPYGDHSSYIIYGLLAFLAIFFVSAYEAGINKKVQKSAALNLLGEASYGIYLFGPVFTLWLGKETDITKAVVILITILFSVLFNYFVERPFLKWTRAKIYN